MLRHRGSRLLRHRRGACPDEHEADTDGRRQEDGDGDEDTMAPQTRPADRGRVRVPVRDSAGGDVSVGKIGHHPVGAPEELFDRLAVTHV
jgi:hypothetical protein